MRQGSVWFLLEDTSGPQGFRTILSQWKTRRPSIETAHNFGALDAHFGGCSFFNFSLLVKSRSESANVLQQERSMNGSNHWPCGSNCEAFPDSMTFWWFQPTEKTKALSSCHLRINPMSKQPAKCFKFWVGQCQKLTLQTENHRKDPAQLVVWVGAAPPPKKNWVNKQSLCSPEEKAPSLTPFLRIAWPHDQACNQVVQ